MSTGVTTYMLVTSLIVGGMNWIGSSLHHLLGKLVPMLANAPAGAKYGIPFPVFDVTSDSSLSCRR